MKLLVVLLILHISYCSAMVNSVQVPNIPYAAYITFSSPQITFYGGGSLISAQHVLTNGANVFGFTAWRIGLGSNRRSSHQNIISNRGVAHPNYSGDNNFRINDIAIIFFNQPVALTREIFPIFLPLPQSKAMPFLNEQGMVLGYAGSLSSGTEGLENLLAAYVRVMEHQACVQLYPLANPTDHFCAVDQSRGSNFCLGDQGGPFTTLSRGKEYLIAVATMPGCQTQPSIYTRISTYRDWITEQTGL